VKPPRVLDQARGGVLIEFVLLLPVLLLLALPLVDYGRAIWAPVALNDATRALANWLSREPAAGLPLPQRLQQAVAAMHGVADRGDDRCFVVTWLVGGAGGAASRASARWPETCRIETAARAPLAQRSLPQLAPGQQAYVVEAFGNQPPIFLRGVLGAAAPPTAVYARAVF